MLYLRLLRLIFNYRQKHSFSLCTRRVHAVCLLLLPFFLCTPLFLLFKFFFVLFLFFRCFCCCCFVLPLFFSSSVCVCACIICRLVMRNASLTIQTHTVCDIICRWPRTVFVFANFCVFRVNVFLVGICKVSWLPFFASVVYLTCFIISMPSGI